MIHYKIWVNDDILSKYWLYLTGLRHLKEMNMNYALSIEQNFDFIVVMMIFMLIYKAYSPLNI